MNIYTITLAVFCILLQLVLYICIFPSPTVKNTILATLLQLNTILLFILILSFIGIVKITRIS